LAAGRTGVALFYLKRGVSPREAWLETVCKSFKGK
jgi:hypothetical protein